MQTKVDCLEKIYEALGGEDKIRCDASICCVLDKIAEIIPEAVSGGSIQKVGGNGQTVDIRTLDTGLYIIAQGSKYQTKADGTTVTIAIDRFMFVTEYYGSKSSFMINTSGYSLQFHNFGLDIREYYMSDLMMKNNTDQYSPATDYNPATKKYVDDAIAALRNELS